MLLKALNAAINESRLILKKGIQLFLYFAVRVPMSSVFCYLTAPWVDFSSCKLHDGPQYMLMGDILQIFVPMVFGTGIINMFMSHPSKLQHKCEVWMSWMIQMLPVIVKVLVVYVDGPVIQCLYLCFFRARCPQGFLLKLRRSNDQSRNVGSFPNPSLPGQDMT